MLVMLLLLNSLLYVFALTLAVTVMSPLGAQASRRTRAAHATLACAGGVTITAAIALAFFGLWFESALAGTIAIVVVGTCMCVGVAREPGQTEDEDEDDDDGGSFHRPVPPEPTKPEGGPSDDAWADFDRARAEWAREHEPTPV
jgi:hypothetical protein